MQDGISGERKYWPETTSYSLDSPGSLLGIQLFLNGHYGTNLGCHEIPRPREQFRNAGPLKDSPLETRPESQAALDGGWLHN